MDNPLSLIDPTGMWLQLQCNPSASGSDFNDHRHGMRRDYHFHDRGGHQLRAAGDYYDNGQGDNNQYIPQQKLSSYQLPVNANTAQSNGCSASTSVTSIVSGSITTNAPTIAAGAAIGGLIGGPAEAWAAAVIGSFLGVGGNVSYVPSSNSLYAGPTVVAGLGVGGGSGVSANVVNVPAGQNANSIANGPSFSLTYQPLPFLGSTVVKSPGSGPPVVEPSVGTWIPVSTGVSYNFCVKGCC